MKMKDLARKAVASVALVSAGAFGMKSVQDHGQRNAEMDAHEAQIEQTFQSATNTPEMVAMKDVADKISVVEDNGFVTHYKEAADGSKVKMDSSDPAQEKEIQIFYEFKSAGEEIGAKMKPDIATLEAAESSHTKETAKDAVLVAMMVAGAALCGASKKKQQPPAMKFAHTS